MRRRASVTEQQRSSTDTSPTTVLCHIDLASEDMPVLLHLFNLLFFLLYLHQTVSSAEDVVPCGTPDVQANLQPSRFRVVNGQIAVRKAWPWAARIFLEHDQNSKLLGGSKDLSA